MKIKLPRGLHFKSCGFEMPGLIINDQGKSIATVYSDKQAADQFVMGPMYARAPEMVSLLLEQARSSGIGDDIEDDAFHRPRGWKDRLNELLSNLKKDFEDLATPNPLTDERLLSNLQRRNLYRIDRLDYDSIGAVILNTRGEAVVTITQLSDTPNPNEWPQEYALVCAMNQAPALLSLLKEVAEWEYLPPKQIHTQQRWQEWRDRACDTLATAVPSFARDEFFPQPQDYRLRERGLLEFLRLLPQEPEFATSPAILAAIWDQARGVAPYAKAIWEDAEYHIGRDGMQQIYDDVTKGGKIDAAQFTWGAAGSGWADGLERTERHNTPAQ